MMRCRQLSPAVEDGGFFFILVCQGDGDDVLRACFGQRVDGGLEGRARGEDVVYDYISVCGV